MALQATTSDGGVGAGDDRISKLIRQDGRRRRGCDGTSGWIWPSARSLAAHMLRHRDLRGLRVLELGSGTGWLALTLARAGAIVTATERDGALPLLTRNVYGCLERLRDDDEVGIVAMDVAVERLHWEDPRRVPGEFDLIVGSDLLYMHESFEPLLRTLVLHECHRCVLTYEERKPEEEGLFASMASAFGFSIVRSEQVGVNEGTGNRILLLDMLFARGKE